MSTSASFEFQTSDVSTVLALHVGVLVEKEAHGMRWVCFVIMWSLKTSFEKSFSYSISYSYSNLKVPIDSDSDSDSDNDDDDDDDDNNN